jgi:hypothetical protein
LLLNGVVFSTHTRLTEAKPPLFLAPPCIAVAHFFTVPNPLILHRLLFLLATVEQEWQHIARYLGITEIVRLAATCTTLNRAMHALPPLGDRRLSVTGDASPDVHTIPDSRVPKEAVGAITAGWSRLRFAYTCRSSVSGTFWSAREKDFKQVRDAPSLCM